MMEAAGQGPKGEPGVGIAEVHERKDHTCMHTSGHGGSVGQYALMSSDIDAAAVPVAAEGAAASVAAEGAAGAGAGR